MLSYVSLSSIVASSCLDFISGEKKHIVYGLMFQCYVYVLKQLYSKYKNSICVSVCVLHVCSL